MTTSPSRSLIVPALSVALLAVAGFSIYQYVRDNNNEFRFTIPDKGKIFLSFNLQNQPIPDDKLANTLSSLIMSHNVDPTKTVVVSKDAAGTVHHIAGNPSGAIGTNHTQYIYFNNRNGFDCFLNAIRPCFPQNTIGCDDISPTCP